MRGKKFKESWVKRLLVALILLMGQALEAGQPDSLQAMERPFPSESPSRQKGKAFLFSLILPGTGEAYAGSKTWATVFATSEITLWTTFAAFRLYGDAKRHDLRLFAVAHAGIDPSGKDDRFFVDIEDYPTRTEYNEAMLKQRRVDALYPETDAYHWAWDSESSRRRYEKLRIAKDKAYSRSLIVVGAIVLNHLASGVDAIRLVHRQHMATMPSFRFGFLPTREGMACSLEVSF